MQSFKTVLIVEDSAINRSILVRILSEDYAVLEAANGKEALEILEHDDVRIAAVILDLLMPVMNGYEFLEKISASERYSNLPVVVATGDSEKESEKTALRKGAWDFVSKPYDSDIIRFRVRNAISRSQLTAYKRLKYLAEYDMLTGVFNKKKFFEETRDMLAVFDGKKFAFYRFDIEHFHLVNSYFGETEGDDILRYIARQMRDFLSARFETAVCKFGRIEADVFGFCIPFECEEQVREIIAGINTMLRRYDIDFDITPSFGVYIICDNYESVNEMYDKANLAAKLCKGNYVNNYLVYNDEMGSKIKREQEIINDMTTALENREFCVYYQPKYELAGSKPTGAEALVRWNHPQKGMVPPSDFIPVFESNGFISKLDAYVWEQVCITLKGWIDQGKMPNPVSVNISRVSTSNPQLVDIFVTLTNKYGIPHRLLNLELTESAYTDNPMLMKKTMDALHREGFVVMMDDFGSGYSSLSILKDIPIDVLKIDMRFFAKSDIPGRGENIVASVVRMAKWLRVPVVAEGVETKKQIDFLRSIGCEYVQGYYFAEPMSLKDYEAYAFEDAPDFSESKETADVENLWSDSVQIERVFSNIMQAIAVYEFDNDSKIDIIKVNSTFYDMFGFTDISGETMDALSVVTDDYKPDLIEIFRKAAQTKNFAEGEYLRKVQGKKPVWIHMRLKYVSSVGDKSILYGMLTDISEQKKMDKELQQYRDMINDSFEITNKILVVDNMEVNRAVIRAIFENRYKVLEAASSEEALEVLEENGNRVDLIILDIEMQENGGSDFMKAKNENPDISGIPIIIVTSDESAEQQMNMMSFGANDYIVKPFVEEIVVRRVQNVLESNRRFRDILKEYNSVVERAQTDPLTGLYNRKTGEELIEKILESKPDSLHAMMILDVDYFKRINDRHGHGCGDEVLVSLSKRLRAAVRPADILMRLGGDEFCLFMPNIRSAQNIVGRCRQICKDACVSENGKIKNRLSVSAGVALCSGQPKTFAELYKNADDALYESKRKGRNIVTLYKADMKRTVQDDIWINKEWLFDSMEYAVLVTDYHTDRIMYTNRNADRLLETERCLGKTCYGVLYGRTERCAFCDKKPLDFDNFYEWSFDSEKLGARLAVREKLIYWNNRKSRLQVIMDISDMSKNYYESTV